jgi:hypothetical protein
LYVLTRPAHTAVFEATSSRSGGAKKRRVSEPVSAISADAPDAIADGATPADAADAGDDEPAE